MTGLIVAAVFFAALVQSISGFGLALVLMGLLAGTLGVPVVAPLVALIAVPIELIVLVRHRQSLNFRSVWRLSIAAALGIPLGMLALRQLDSRIVLTALGLVIVGYAVYALANPALPELTWPGWAYGIGFVAGVLSGAYNVAGPPVVLYGSSQRWSPREFKGNLQGFFLLNDVLVIAGHAVSRNLTPVVWANLSLALPAVGLGVLVGLGLERYIDPAIFRQLVLLLLIVTGLRLIF